MLQNILPNNSCSITYNGVNSLHADLFEGAGHCVFNAFLAIAAIILSCITVQALRKTSSLSKALKALLLSLAVSDLSAGLLVDPVNCGLLVKWLQLGD